MANKERRSRIPAFPYPGGKVRIRNFILNHMPLYGDRYIELFAGLGNMFWLSKSYLKFNKWLLRDLDVRFFEVLKRIDLDLLVNGLEKEDFNSIRMRHDDLSILLEPRISFCGKGYASAYNVTHTNSYKYLGDNYRQVCLKARELLKDVELQTGDYKYFDWGGLGKDDFLYLDPPYVGVEISTYANIDHEDLVERLNKTDCRWLLSGYDNDLYEEELRFKNKFSIKRNVDIRQYNSREKEEVYECIWRSF